MKKVPQHIEQEIEKTLASLDGLQPARPKPFFFTRLKGRMENRMATKQSGMSLSPVLRHVLLAVILVLITVNLFTVSQFLGKSTDAFSVVTEEDLTFIEDYYPETTTLYTLDQNIIE